jgi:hypothetical protein
MPRKRLPPADRAPGTDNASPRLSDDQLGRLAELIADGRCQPPEDLPPADRRRLQVEVRLRLRARLVRLIARAIAHHLRRDAGPRSETADHA